MNRLIGLFAAVLLSTAFGAATADEKAMREHQEMGTQGVAPHMTKEKQKELTKQQREQSMKEHQEMGTQGVAPHMTKEKQKELTKQQREQDMQKHMQEGSAGATPHELKKKRKQAARSGSTTPQSGEN